MGYALGVDLGTTYSAAATAEGGTADRFPLGNRTATIPSVVCLRADGEVLVGEAAERRALTEPSRTAREFKRRLGDPTPLILGGTPYGAEALSAHLLRWIVGKVAEQKGAPPDAIVLSHPANWGPYKLELLAQTVQAADVGAIAFITEPEAAAIHYASQERLADGEVVAVYDFGGGTFDAAVLRKTGDGFALLGQPEGLERIGGIDFDQAIFAHVDQATGGALAELDPADTSAMAAVHRLRDECQLAKEQLSQDTDVDIPVLLPGLQTEVRLTRAEFEGMIRPRIEETIASLRRAIRSADLTEEAVARVLLVGGSSRIPLIGQMVREATGRPIALDAHPKFAIAIGAALTGAASTSAESGGSTPAATTPAAPAAAVVAPPEPEPTPDPTTAASPPEPEPEPAAVAPTPSPAPAAAGPGPMAEPVKAAPDTGVASGPGGRPPWMYAAAAAVAVLVIVGLTQVLGGGDDPDVAVGPTDPPTTSAPSPSATATNAASSPADALPSWVAEAAPDGRFVEIRSLAIDEYGMFVPEFDLYNLAGNESIRWYFNDVTDQDMVSPATQATATEGQAVPTWADIPAGEPFDGFSVLDRPMAATHLCALALDADGYVPVNQENVPWETGNCAPIPFAEITGDLLPGNRFVEFTSITEADGRWILDFTTHNFAPEAGSGWHLHNFWYPTQSKDWVGGNVRPNTWTIWTESGPVDKAYFDVANRPADATHICVVVAQADHTIKLQEDGTGYPSGNCLALEDTYSGT